MQGTMHLVLLTAVPPSLTCSSGSVQVVKLNAENEKALAAALRVANVPTVIFIMDYTVVMKLDCEGSSLP